MAFCLGTQYVHPPIMLLYVSRSIVTSNLPLQFRPGFLGEGAATRLEKIVGLMFGMVNATKCANSIHISHVISNARFAPRRDAFFASHSPAPVQFGELACPTVL